jgi:hypothetical protein
LTSCAGYLCKQAIHHRANDCTYAAGCQNAHDVHAGTVADAPGSGRTADLPIFRSLANSSPNTAHVRGLHCRIDLNITERRRTHTDETTTARLLRGDFRPW